MAFPKELQPHLDEYIKNHHVSTGGQTIPIWQSKISEGRTPDSVRQDVIAGYGAAASDLKRWNSEHKFSSSNPKDVNDAFTLAERHGYEKRNPKPVELHVMADNAIKPRVVFVDNHEGDENEVHEYDPERHGYVEHGFVVHARQKTPFGGEVSSSAEVKAPTYSYTMPVRGSSVIAHDSGQPVIFDAKVEHPPVVNALTRDEDAEGLVPSTLGAVVQESKKRWGMTPAPSRDLSGASLPMVKRLVDKGLLPKPDKEYTQVNSLDQTDWAETKEEGWRDKVDDTAALHATNSLPSSVSYRKYSSEEVKGAGDEFKNMLRKPKNPNIGQQFQQMNLF
jgi:hypothetical protein